MLSQATKVYSAPVVGIIADHNIDGFVSHADYSVLGDLWGGDPSSLPNRDPANMGPIGAADLAAYIANYHEMLSLPSVLPLSITPTPTPAGNVVWLFAFSAPMGFQGALGGHLNIETDGPEILNVDGGPMFMNDALSPQDMPGIDWNGDIKHGIITDGNRAFAALGSTLGSVLGPSPVTFLTVETRGTQPTMLTVEGEYGYLGDDYVVSDDAMFVPEPSSLTLLWIVLASLAFTRRGSRRH
jgi:hypothetical protein